MSSEFGQPLQFSGSVWWQRTDAPWVKASARLSLLPSDQHARRMASALASTPVVQMQPFSLDRAKIRPVLNYLLYEPDTSATTAVFAEDCPQIEQAGSLYQTAGTATVEHGMTNSRSDAGVGAGASTFDLADGSYVTLPRLSFRQDVGGYWTARIGEEDYVVVSDGLPVTIGSGLTLRLMRQTVWVVPVPVGLRAILADELWVEGVHFSTFGTWAAFFRDPSSLPETTACWIESAGPHPKFAATAEAPSAARYRKEDQSTRSFERALGDLVGERDVGGRTVVRVERLCRRTVHWLDDGSSHTLPGPPLHNVGERLGSRPSSLRLYSLADGPIFWEWTKGAIYLHEFQPSWPKILLNRPVYGVRQGDGVFYSEIDFHLPDPDYKVPAGWVDLARVLCELTASRLLILATDLPTRDPMLWHRLRWWALRERPATSLLVLAQPRLP
jgi:hypothetical protein